MKYSEYKNTQAQKLHTILRHEYDSHIFNKKNNSVITHFVQGFKFLACLIFLISAPKEQYIYVDMKAIDPYISR